MAAVFRTLVSSQEPIIPQQKRSSPSNNANTEESEQSPSTQSKSEKRTHKLFKSRLNVKKNKNKNKKEATPLLPDTTGLEVTREASTDTLEPTETQSSTESPMYFNHPRTTLQAREANRRGNRDSYLPMLRSLARGAPSPSHAEDEANARKTPDAPEDIYSPRSYWDDSSDDEKPTRTPKSGRMLKKSMQSLKLSTSNLFARSRVPAGGSGSSSAEPGSSFALGISGIEMGITPVSPVIGSPTGIRRLDGGREWDSIRAGRSVTSPSMAESPSSSSVAAETPQKKKLGKMSSMSNLGDWFWGRSQEQLASPTGQYPCVASGSGSPGLRGQSPAMLARAQRRQASALPAIAERPASPASSPGDRAEEDEEPVSDSSSWYQEDAQPDALPAPLLVVKREEGEHTRRVRMSRSLSELRTAADEGDELTRSASGPVGAGIVQHGHEGIPPVPPLPATAPLPQRAFPRRRSLERDIRNFFARDEPSLTTEIAQTDRAVVRAACREEYGLESYSTPHGYELRHPNHGFKWNTESLMCFGKHNPSDLLTPADTAISFAPAGSNEVTDLSNLTITRSSFASVTRNDDHEQIINDAKQCPFCDRYCCHYIELLAFLRSAPTPTTASPQHADVEDERDRIKAKERVDRLKQEQPNGVDSFETFVVCEGCGREVCKDCARRCEDELCESVRCVRCGDECWCEE